MEEVLHIEDLEHWKDKLSSFLYTRHWMMKRGLDLSKINAKIKEVENKITQIENLKQNVS